MASDLERIANKLSLFLYKNVNAYKEEKEMLRWIEMLNKMYEEHPYTGGGRVVISYCPEMDVVVIKVLDKYKIIECGLYNDLGILYIIQDTVREMY